MAKLDVFISNAGSRSRSLAEKLREWLPLVINDLKPWVASADITPGKNWVLELQERMSPGKGVFCLLIVTPENKLQHWLHFEMGVMLKAASDGAVVPVLFDLTPDELHDPIKQYTGVTMDENGMLKLLEILNDASGNTLKSEQLQKAFKNNGEEER